MNYHPMTIYLAGKVRKNDWRHVLVDGLRDAIVNEDGMSDMLWDGHPVLENAIFGAHHYSGPFPVSDDHGGFHGPSTHGVVAYATSPHKEDDDRAALVRACLRQIDRADLVVAWVDAESAYGTMVELGYASALKKPMYLSTPIDLPEHWFAGLLPGSDGWHHHDDAASALVSAIALHGQGNAAPKLANPRNKFVYLLKAGDDRYKIGVSLSVADRVKQLQTANPHPIQVIHYVEVSDYLGLEAHLHNVMAQKRMSGEWFRLNDGDVTDVCYFMDIWGKTRQNVTTLYATKPVRPSLRDRVRGAVQP